MRGAIEIEKIEVEVEVEDININILDLFKLQVRYDQKMAKYGHLAQQRDLRFIPAVFSHTGQIHEAFKVFVKEQIRLKFEAFEGEVKRSKSKVRSYMNWWIKCISAVIVKTASRNVAFKATRMRDSIMDGQDKFIMRESDNAEVGVREDCDEVATRICWM